MSVELQAQHADVLTPDALEFVSLLHRRAEPDQACARRAEARTAARTRRGRAARLPRGDPRASGRRTGSVAEAPPDLQDRRCEITGPVDRKMMINALNSGARVFMADFEDACSPTFENVMAGQRNVHDAVRRTIELETEAKTYSLNDEIATLIIRAARLASARAPCARRRRARVGEPVRLRAHRLPQRARAARARNRAVLLPAEAREPPGGPAVGAGLRPGGGRARTAARIDPLHRAHRDDPRRVRDGRDPVRAARLRLRAERRALGLHLQRDQEARCSAARPRAGDDGRAVHARVHRIARANLPPARRARDRRHGGLHPFAQGSRGERGRPRQGARGQGARVAIRLRRHLGRSSRSGPGRDRVL